MNLNQLINILSKNYEIVVGFPKDKQVVYPPDDRKPNVAPRSRGGQTVAQVARQNEFGTTKYINGKAIRIPSRPFLRTALRKNKNKIIDLVKAHFKLKNINDTTYFDKVGQIMQGMVRDSIKNGNWIPNAPFTKLQKLKHETYKQLIKGKLKNFDKVTTELENIKPLIDRGIMIRSVNYEVRIS